MTPTSLSEVMSAQVVFEGSYQECVVLSQFGPASIWQGLKGAVWTVD